MSLDLSQLPMLLNLPCKIKSSHNLLDTSICAKAENPHPFMYKHTVDRNETLPQFLQRIYQKESYDMDCSLYAQLASLVLSRKWGDDFVLSIAAKEDVETFLWMTKIPEMGYIGVSNDRAASHLMTLPVAFKGQWVIQINSNSFLGLTCDGPCVKTMEEWISYLRNKLEEYSLADTCESFQQIGTVILRIYFKLGLMNEWGFYTLMGIPSITAICTSNGIEINSIESKINTLSMMIKSLCTSMSRSLGDFDGDHPQFSFYNEEDSFVYHRPQIVLLCESNRCNTMLLMPKLSLEPKKIDKLPSKPNKREKYSKRTKQNNHRMNFGFFNSGR